MLHHSLLRMWSLCRNLINQTIASLMAVAQVLLEEMESACEVYIAHDAKGLGADRASRLCCRYQTNISMRWFPSEISILSNFAFCFVPIAVLGFVLMEKTKARHRCRLSHVGSYWAGPRMYTNLTFGIPVPRHHTTICARFQPPEVTGKLAMLLWIS